jgi:hypothetical protein
MITCTGLTTFDDGAAAWTKGAIREPACSGLIPAASRGNLLSWMTASTYLITFLRLSRNARRCSNMPVTIDGDSSNSTARWSKLNSNFDAV